MKLIETNINKFNDEFEFNQDALGYAAGCTCTCTCSCSCSSSSSAASLEEAK